jgi:hypothetical protein
MTRILDLLPPLYAGLLPAVFRRRIPEESLADCARCPMCRRPGEPRALRGSYFRPDARCCTFYPSLPNYLAGALLEGRSAALREGRGRLRRLLLDPGGADALAVGPPPGQGRRHARWSDRGFGRWHSLLCPYFRRGANDCSIWAYRNSVCSAYFCRPAGGIPGAEFWRAVQRYLGVVERALARHAAGDPGRCADGGRPRLGRRGGRASPWEERYREAYEIVRRMDPRSVARVGGAEARQALEAVRLTLRRMLDRSLPERLRCNPALSARRTRHGVHLEVPGALAYLLATPTWEALRCFDGKREQEAVVRTVRRERGLELTREFLLAAYRAGILLSDRPRPRP